METLTWFLSLVLIRSYVETYNHIYVYDPNSLPSQFQGSQGNTEKPCVKQVKKRKRSNVRFCMKYKSFRRQWDGYLRAKVFFMRVINTVIRKHWEVARCGVTGRFQILDQRQSVLWGLSRESDPTWLECDLFLSILRIGRSLQKKPTVKILIYRQRSVWGPECPWC